jgi:hypothetical protein
MFSSSQIEFWTKERTLLLVRIFTLLMLLGIGASFVQDIETKASVWKGDYPTFYSGAMAFETFGAQGLYDLDYQKSVQHKNWPSLGTSYAPFIYPPYVAPMVWPFAKLNPQQGVLVFIAVMFAAFLLASKCLQKTVELPQAKFLDFVCVLFLFAPISGGIFGSQNSALSLLLYILVLFFYKDRSPRSQVLAGCCAGLWLFKPQYPALILLCSILGRKWRFVLGASIPAAIYYAIAAYMFGPLWPVEWLKVVETATSAEILGNAHQHISFRGVSTAIALYFGLSDVQPISIASGIVSLALAAFVCYWAWKSTKYRINGKDLFEDLLYLLGPVVLIASPHAHYYDLAFCVPFIARLFKPKSDLNISLLACVYMIAFVVSSNRHLIVVNPLVLLPLALIIIGARQFRKDLA